MKRAGFPLVVAALALALAACDTARTLVPQAPPVADSPAGAVRVFESAFDRRDLGAVDALLPDDWQLLSVDQDSAGNPTPIAWSRDSMLVALRAMFQGVPGVSAPAEVHVTLDRDLIPVPDARPGR